MSLPLAAGATIGMLGGGQLGRMMSMAAARLGYRTIVLDPDPNSPAAEVAAAHIVAAYDDVAALAALAEQCDVVTYEFENVPEETVAALSERVLVRPGQRALAVAQDRLIEKQFLRDAGLATAPYVAVNDQAELVAAVAELGGHAIVKTRRFGYDGKGQLRINSAPPTDAYEQLGSVPLIAEGVVAFEREISVVVARAIDGSVRCFDPAHNEHVDGILASSTVPAGISQQVDEVSKTWAANLAEALDYVGVLGLELFVMADGSLVANEFAPRVHNSGHWTEAACVVSQFEQHIRAVAGLPLGDPARHSDCVMENLIGAEVAQVPDRLADGDVLIHLYGKRETRPGRKMGHLTRVFPTQTIC